MSQSFKACEDQHIAYSENGPATVYVGASGASEPLKGPLYVGVPALPDHYRPRDSDLAALKAILLGGSQDAGILGGARAAGLRGMGGLGKTVLAAALAADPEIRQAFPYGIVWLSFGRKADALTQLATLARAVTGRPAGYTSTSDARVDLGRLLADRHMLLVLDDVWEVAQVDGFRSLAPFCQLLITTRRQPVLDRAGAGTHELGLLNPPASRALFVDALGQNDLPPEADSLIVECGGLPLAIAAASAMVRRSGWAHARQAFARARLDALKTPWLPDSEQENLAIVLSASVQALPPLEQACFRECAVWPEDVSVPLDALSLFWSAHVSDPFDQREIAASLVDASVLQRGSGDTLRLHDLYQDYLRHVAGETVSSMHAAVADRCVRFTDGSPELVDQSPWSLQYLPWHLVRAGRLDQARDLQLNFKWLAAKFAAMGVQPLVADSNLLQDLELQLLGRALRLSAHVLAQHSDQLAAQLLGRLHRVKSSGLQRLITEVAGRIPPGGLVPKGEDRLTEPGAMIAVLPGHRRSVWGALLLPDGRRALSWSDDGTLRLWDLESGEGRPLKGHRGPVRGALLLPDGRRALSWSIGGMLRLWDLESGEGRPLEGHRGEVRGALLLPDGRRALSWSGDHALRLWDLESGEGRPLEGHRSSVQGALLLPDGRRALSWSDDGTLRLWDLESGEGRPLKGHGGSVLGALLLPDARRALSWSYDHTLRLWDLESGEGRPLEGHRGSVRGALLLPDGRRALSWSGDHAFRLWDLESGEGRPLEGHRGAVRGALLLPDGRRALSWSGDHALRLWDLESGEGRPLEGHRSSVQGALLLPDGRRALSWSNDCTLRLWDFDSQSQIAFFVGDDPITCVAFAPECRTLIAGDRRGRMLFFDFS